MAASKVTVNGLGNTATNECLDLPTSKDSDVINLDQGDPTMYESFWREAGGASTFTLPGWQNMSYFSDPSNLCWFLHPDLSAEIRRIHHLVGNTIADDGRHIVVGNGSSQLFHSALFALSTAPTVAKTSRPVPVVSAAPYYSGYPPAADFLHSGLYRWAGDANSFDSIGICGGGPCIEVICSPNNPDGKLNKAVLQSACNSRLETIHDLAYYWPQYTSITAAADHSIMLFTVSKCTGHAGTRIGWALVKDAEVARRMVKFIELSTIGVSKDSQMRAATLLRAVSDGYEHESGYKLFHFGRKVMAERWELLRKVAEANGVFSLMEYPPDMYCSFMGKNTTHLPAFAWLKSERDDIEDAANYLRTNHKILCRSGQHFGMDNKYVRISMVDRDKNFNAFIERLSSIH